MSFGIFGAEWRSHPAIMRAQPATVGTWFLLAMHAADRGDGTFVSAEAVKLYATPKNLAGLLSSGLLLQLESGDYELCDDHKLAPARNKDGASSDSKRNANGSKSESDRNKVGTTSDTSRNEVGDKTVLPKAAFNHVETPPSESDTKTDTKLSTYVESAVGAPVSPSAPPPALEQVAMVAGHLNSAAPPKPETKRAVAKPNTRVPATGVDPDQLAAWCERWTIDAKDSEFVRFLDHFRGTGVTHADWGATWRNWQRRAGEFAARSNGAGGGGYASARSRQVQQGNFENPFWERAKEIT